MTLDTDQPRLNYVTCASPAGAHRMAYWEWGDPRNDRVLVCVHGLTRTGRDFDELAKRAKDSYRVVCPDVVGRGKSDWLVKGGGYIVPQYVADMVTLLARLAPSTVDWVGTSMGGIIGMVLAGMLDSSPAHRPDRNGYGLPETDNLHIRKMVLNDVGPALTLEGLQRIATYVGQPGRFSSFDQAVDYVKDVSAGFGRHTDDEWRDLTRYVVVKDGDAWVKHYDLRIAEPFAQQTLELVQASEKALWGAYQSIRSPLLILRGEHSDLFAADAAQQMVQRHPDARLHTVADTGHAPSLRSADQCNAVLSFLQST